MKYSWFVFALIEKVASFQSRSSGYMKHMEIAPAALPEGLILTFFGVMSKVFYFILFYFILFYFILSQLKKEILFPHPGFRPWRILPSRSLPSLLYSHPSCLKAK